MNPSTDDLDVSEVVFHLLQEHPHQYRMRPEANERRDVALVKRHRTLLCRLQNAIQETFVFTWSGIHHSRLQDIEWLRQCGRNRTLELE